MNRESVSTADLFNTVSTDELLKMIEKLTRLRHDFLQMPGSQQKLCTMQIADLDSLEAVVQPIYDRCMGRN